MACLLGVHVAHAYHSLLVQRTDWSMSGTASHCQHHTELHSSLPEISGVPRPGPLFQREFHWVKRIGVVSLESGGGASVLLVVSHPSDV